jgi:hypothetical protein
VFRISTLYTPGNPSLGIPGYWTPNANFTASGGATCKVVSQDVGPQAAHLPFLDIDEAACEQLDVFRTLTGFSVPGKE